jgi:hypothetical protein
MTNEYIKRQLSLLKDFISDYESGRISLNRFIMRVDAVLALDDMCDAYKSLGDKLITLEEINAGVFEGAELDENDVMTINKIIFEITEYIKYSIAE